ncbi:MAG: GNAT family N-acetyltransferase [Synergistaceae bacterium]|nr:GNAT family N-acetyltransferase [Synergistaceae bacterium]
MLIADIRFCDGEDAGQVLAVDKTSPHPWPENVITRDLIAGDSRISYIGAFAPVDGSIMLGYAALGEENGNGLLMNLVVLPQYHRRGIGVQLVVAAAELAYGFGFLRLVLRVRLTNYAALALYRGLGFICDATRDGFYSDGNVAGFMSARLPLDL